MPHHRLNLVTIGYKRATWVKFFTPWYFDNHSVKRLGKRTCSPKGIEPFERPIEYVFRKYDIFILFVVFRKGAQYWKDSAVKIQSKASTLGFLVSTHKRSLHLLCRTLEEIRGMFSFRMANLVCKKKTQIDPHLIGNISENSLFTYRQGFLNLTLIHKMFIQIQSEIFSRRRQRRNGGSLKRRNKRQAFDEDEEIVEILKGLEEEQK